MIDCVLLLDGDQVVLDCKAALNRALLSARNNTVVLMLQDQVPFCLWLCSLFLTTGFFKGGFDESIKRFHRR